MEWQSYMPKIKGGSPDFTKCLAKVWKVILSKLYINLIIFSIIGLKGDGKANRLHVIPLSTSNISGQSLLFDQQFYHVTFGDGIQGRRKV